jgi:hypothetical protein
LTYSEIHTDEEKQTATGFWRRSVSSRPALDLQGVYVRCRRRAVGRSRTAQLHLARLEAPTGESSALPRRSCARTGAGRADSPAGGPPYYVPVGRGAPVPGSGGCPPGWARVGHTVRPSPTGRDVDPRHDEVRQRPGLLGPERLFWEYNGYSLYGDLSQDEREGRPHPGNQANPEVYRPSNVPPRFTAGDIAIGTCDPRDVVGGTVGGRPEGPNPRLIVYSTLSGRLAPFLDVGGAPVVSEHLCCPVGVGEWCSSPLPR